MKFRDASAIVPLLVRQARSRDPQEILGADATLVCGWGTPVDCRSALMRLSR